MAVHGNKVWILWEKHLQTTTFTRNKNIDCLKGKTFKNILQEPLNTYVVMDFKASNSPLQNGIQYLTSIRYINYHIKKI